MSKFIAIEHYNMNPSFKGGYHSTRGLRIGRNEGNRIEIGVSGFFVQLWRVQFAAGFGWTELGPRRANL